MSDEHPVVRIGTPADFPRMLEFLKLMHAENGIMPLSMDRVVPFLQCALAHHQSLVGIIDGDDGDIAASVGLMIGQYWYSETKHLEDAWNFVRAEYRTRPMARPLIEFAKRAADGLHVPLLMGVLSETRTMAKVRLYERQLKFVGAIFTHYPTEIGAS